MSQFFSGRFDRLTPYTPGEQPVDKAYIKLNTNESPFPPSDKAIAAAEAQLQTLHLYPDPTCGKLRAALADAFGVTPRRVLVGNGSDEVLSFAFMAYGEKGVAYPDITYGFYRVFADLYGLDALEIPLREDFTIDPEQYKGLGRTIFIANPNAPTGIPLSRRQVEDIVAANPDTVVVIDEAYVDFGGETAVPLTDKYDNLLVVGTFSKSRSMAGARLGYAIGCPALIGDLETLRHSTNPYNVNRMTLAAGLGQLADEETTRRNCQTIVDNRQYTAAALERLGFSVLPSAANFLFATCPRIAGKGLYLALKERGILVRHFDTPRLSDYNRITIGSRQQMDTLLNAIQAILEE